MAEAKTLTTANATGIRAHLAGSWKWKLIAALGLPPIILPFLPFAIPEPKAEGVLLASANLFNIVLSIHLGQVSRAAHPLPALLLASFSLALTSEVAAVILAAFDEEARISRII
ncbi:hypothetical protein GGR52DRAFT_375335 [Hypoxylon sp. FL1284]|nr:hypothetical protein GGR52DRAFT_375335 [Hypoxylon sp. FL1284]